MKEWGNSEEVDTPGPRLLGGRFSRTGDSLDLRDEDEDDEDGIEAWTARTGLRGRRGRS